MIIDTQANDNLIRLFFSGYVTGNNCSDNDGEFALFELVLLKNLLW